MDEPSDLELIRRFGADDAAERQAAFTALFERHQKRAFDLAYRVLGDAALASDAAQEAFLTVYKKGARFEARARFTSWLYRVVLNQCIDLKRREKRHRMLPLASSGARDMDSREGGGVPEPAAPPGAGPLATALGSERAELVQAAILELSPKLAEVIVLRYPQGLSYEEIGEILEVPPGTVKSRLNRAHAALRGILGEQLDDGGVDTNS
jgi:RNA polymerase sigma-70 factor (ECF subfamily)